MHHGRQRSRGVRGSLATVVLAASGLYGAAAGGCGSSSGAAAPSYDASEDFSVGPQDGSGGGEGPGADVDAGVTVAPPTVYVVNASPDAPPLRFCFGLGPTVDGGAVVVAGALPASPDRPAAGAALAGVYPGLGGWLDDHGLDLASLALHLFALDATNAAVAANTADGGPEEGGLESPCEALIGSDGLGAAHDAGAPLVLDRDYFDLGVLPAGTLAHGTTWLLAVTGCRPAETNAATLCPSPYDPEAGNVALRAWQLDSTTAIAAGALGAQLAQASSEWDLFANAHAATLSAGFLVPGAVETDAATADAGNIDAAGATTALPIASGVHFGDLAPAKLASVTDLSFDGATAFFVQASDVSDAAVAPTPQAFPLPAVQARSWPGVVPEGGVLRDGAGFVFVLLGNPLAGWYVNAADGGPSSGPDAGGVFNGHAAHMLAFPVAHP